MKRHNKMRTARRGKPLGDTEYSEAESASDSSPYVEAAKEGGLILLAAIAACGVGAAIGKHSLITGIPVTLIGVHKKNPYIVAAGLGLTLSNGFQRSASSVQGVEGIDIKQVAHDAQDRVKTFFENFKEKLYISNAGKIAASSPSTEGLADTPGEEQVTYFVNPYKEAINTAEQPIALSDVDASEIDMSAIDRIQEQIAEMSKGGTPTAGLNETEREF
jgi:hypothetical protein